MATYFLHDVPHSVLRTGPDQLREEATEFLPSRAPLSTGPTSPFTFWPEAMTAFSQSNFNDASHVKGWERRYSKYPVVISSRCQMPKD